MCFFLPLCVGIVSKCKRKLCKQRQDNKLKFIAQFCRLAIYGYILRSNTWGNTLRWDSYGRYGSILGVHLCYIDEYYWLDIELVCCRWSMFSVSYYFRIIKRAQCTARAIHPLHPPIHSWSSAKREGMGKMKTRLKFRWFTVSIKFRGLKLTYYLGTCTNMAWTK